MKSFRLNIILRVLLILLLMVGVVYYFLVDVRYLRATYFLVFTGLAVWELIAYNNRTNRDISTFLLSLLQQDFTTTFHAQSKGKSFRHMYESFNEVTRRFKELSAVREARHQYLEALIEHVQIGLVSFDENEKVHLVNETFGHIANTDVIRSLEDLAHFQPELLSVIREMEAGHDRVLRIKMNAQLVPLNLYMTEFKVGDDSFRLVSVQNIRAALDQQEVDSYQKLIRVLTHEIMNSVSPISSLSESLFGIVSRHQILQGEAHENVEKGLEAIRNRSKGLETFTGAYKQLTRMPRPHFEDVDLATLAHRVVRLTDIPVTIGVDDSLLIRADENLMEQVLINLLKNAAEAVQIIESPHISLSAVQEGSFTEIVIEDNGAGIPEDKIDKIFIPFFTTKEEGSGIGLALCRQIVKTHGGSLEVQSEPGRTKFLLRL